MSPRRSIAVVPAVLALALSVSGANALRPAEHASASAPVDTPSFADLPDTAVVANGPVEQVVLSGDRVYVRGSFDRIGRYSGPGRILDTGTGADRPAPALPDGQVSVTVPDGDGGWYVGGDFGMDVYGPGDGGLAHVRADGTLDPEFDATTDGLVSALALDGDTLYVGGQFSHVGESTRQNVGAVSATDGSTLPFRADQTERVTELATGTGRVYVGTDHVAAVDPVTGAAVAGFTSPVEGDVTALALGGGRLYVGTTRLVAADPVTGAKDLGFDVSIAGASGGHVHTLLYTGDTLYAGTDADAVDGRPGRLVALDPATGAADPGFDPEVTGGTATFGAPGGVFDLALAGDHLWVGGAFDHAGGEPAGDLAVLDPATGAAAGVDVPSFDHQVNAVDVSGDAAYVGGHFYLQDPAHTKSIAALDATTLEPVPGFRVTKETYGGDLVAAPNAIYAAPTHFYGYYPRAQHPPYFSAGWDTIRAYDPDTGAVDAARTHARVRNLTGITTLGDELVVAQRLSNDVKFPRNRITVYAPNGRKDRSFLVPLRGYISYLTTVDGDLLAVGSFKRSTPEGFPRDAAMVRFRARDGLRRTYFDPKIDGPVYDAAVQGHTIFASGLFHQVFQGLDFASPGLTKLFARSGKSEEFQPASFESNRVLLRLSAVGDQLWVGWPRNKFLDSSTGAVLPDPTGGRADEISSVVRTRAGLDFSTIQYGVNIGGSSWNIMGYVGRTED
ncbi:hypothetical protein [Nocardioides sp. URHA0032]|uniref:hypothetical protein n=1 Tax=Nocardioides sp. URHA0032 TaxID=1380388 RepID=UPI00048F44B6|nr:hypothetical protein [Nocardioides sp. URHA0032]